MVLSLSSPLPVCVVDGQQKTRVFVSLCKLIHTVAVQTNFDNRNQTAEKNGKKKKKCSRSANRCRRLAFNTLHTIQSSSLPRIYIILLHNIYTRASVLFLINSSRSLTTRRSKAIVERGNYTFFSSSSSHDFNVCVRAYYRYYYYCNYFYYYYYCNYYIYINLL